MGLDIPVLQTQASTCALSRAKKKGSREKNMLIKKIMDGSFCRNPVRRPSLRHRYLQWWICLESFIEFEVAPTVQGKDGYGKVRHIAKTTHP
jgi:hypothetical protein